VCGTLSVEALQLSGCGGVQMGLSNSATEAIGEVMEGAVQALEGTMPLKRKGGPEIKP